MSSNNSKPNVSGHWLHYRERGTEGFDVQWDAVNYPNRSKIKGLITDTLDRLNRARAAAVCPYAAAFRRLWPEGPIKEGDIQKIGSNLVPVAALAANYANTIFSFLKLDRPRILEIGAGSGYLAYYLSKLYPGSSFTIIDLEEVIPYAQKNLARLHTNADFLTPNQLDEAPEVDLAVNTASFQEMLPDTINVYFELIRRKSSYFYSCNRVEKWIGYNSGGEGTGDIPVRFSEYPWFGEDMFYRVSRIHRLICAEPSQERLIKND